MRRACVPHGRHDAAYSRVNPYPLVQREEPDRDAAPCSPPRSLYYPLSVDLLAAASAADYPCRIWPFIGTTTCKNSENSLLTRKLRLVWIDQATCARVVSTHGSTTTTRSGNQGHTNAPTLRRDGTSHTRARTHSRVTKPSSEPSRLTNYAFFPYVRLVASRPLSAPRAATCNESPEGTLLDFLFI